MDAGSRCSACGVPDLGTKFCESCGVALLRPEFALAPGAPSPESSTPDVRAAVGMYPHVNPASPVRTTGWQKAGKVADGAGKVIEGTALVIMKLYAVFLMIVALILIFATMGAGILPGLLILAYGIYLIVPGSKLVVW